MHEKKKMKTEENPWKYEENKIIQKINKKCLLSKCFSLQTFEQVYDFQTKILKG